MISCVQTEVLGTLSVSLNIRDRAKDILLLGGEFPMYIGVCVLEGCVCVYMCLSRVQTELLHVITHQQTVHC